MNGVCIHRVGRIHPHGVPSRIGCLSSFLFLAAAGFSGPTFGQVHPKETVHSFLPAPYGTSPSAALIQASDGNLYGTTDNAGDSPFGTVFSIANPMTAPTPRTIYHFTGAPDGSGPEAAVVQASDGNLYGTTYAGGTFDRGTIFTISNPTTSPVGSVLFSFSGGRDGSNPKAPLIESADGSLYGTASTGGDYGAGVVFRISNLAGTPTFSLVYSFAGGADGAGPWAALIEFPDGTLYGTTNGGGSSGTGTVFKISNPATLPAESVIYSFAGGVDGANPHAAMIRATDGNLYGTASGGGAAYDGAVFEIANPDSTPTEGVIHSFGGVGNDGIRPEGALLQASDGAFYGTTYSGGSISGGTVYKISDPTTLPSESVIFNFCCAAGNNPQSALIQALDGNLYGTAYSTVFAIVDPGGAETESTVFSFPTGRDGRYPCLL